MFPEPTMWNGDEDRDLDSPEPADEYPGSEAQEEDTRYEGWTDGPEDYEPNPYDGTYSEE